MHGTPPVNHVRRGSRAEGYTRLPRSLGTTTLSYPTYLAFLLLLYSLPASLVSSFPYLVASLSLSLVDCPYSSLPPSLPPLFFPFTFRRRLTVVSCSLYRLAPPLLRAIQPTLYEKTLRSFFATGRGCYYRTAATRLGNSRRGREEEEGKDASIYAYNAREKIARLLVSRRIFLLDHIRFVSSVSIRTSLVFSLVSRFLQACYKEGKKERKKGRKITGSNGSKVD